MTRVLVTGGAGFLGSETIRQALARGDDVVGTVRHRRPTSAGCELVPVDLCDPEATGRLVQAVRPELVVHTAYVQHEWLITAVAPGAIAAAARVVGAEFVQISSDTVFSGRAERYTEDDLPDPTSPYGAAKAAAETAVRAVHPGSAVIRLPLLLGGRGSAAEDLVRAIVEGRSDRRLFTDDIRCPAHVSDVARGALELAGQPGVHHLAGPDAVNRLEVARLVCAREGWSTDRLRPGLRADAGLPGPLTLRLDGARTQSRLRTRMRGARELA